jgi:mediator of RNA polymerase II transcription subunit 16
VHAFINQSCIACLPLGAHFDYVNLVDDSQKQTQTLYKGQFFYKCLSMQNVLGMGENGRRNLPAKLAWTTLNIRLLSLSLSQSLKANENIRHGRIV